MKKLWKGIWNLKVPNRVKNLISKAASDSLPLKSNLSKRQIPIDTTCTLCGLEPETSVHAIWSCPSLLQIQNVHFGWLISETGKASSFLDVLQRFAEKSNLMGLLAMIVHQIWTRRNKLRLGDVVAPLGMISQMASTSLQDFQQSSLNPPKVPSLPKASKWLPPPSNWVKVNFDGATFGNTSSTGLGAIIRNDLGLVMVAFTQPFHCLLLQRWWKCWQLGVPYVSQRISALTR